MALVVGGAFSAGPALATAAQPAPRFFGSPLNLGDLGQHPEPSIAIDPLRPANVIIAAPQGVTAGALGTAPQGVGGASAGAPGDTALVRSRDGGRHFTGVVYSHAPEAGGDADVEFDDRHSVYLTSLSGSGSEFCHSFEGDAYVSVNDLPCGADPLSRSNIEQDRPWLTRDGRYFYATSHDLVAQQPMVEFSEDHLKNLQHCGAVLPAGSPAMLNLLPLPSTQVSKPVVDSASRLIVPVLEQLPTQHRGVGQAGAGALYVSVSSDHCNSFTPHAVFISPQVNFFNLFTSVTVDKADNLYVGVVGVIPGLSPDRAAYLFTSHDHGVHWSAPRRMSSPGSHSAYLPVVQGGRAGEIVMGWFDTAAAPDDSSPTQTWRYVVAASGDGGRHLQRSSVGATVAHRGPIEQTYLGDFTSMTIDRVSDQVLVTFAQDSPQHTDPDVIVARQTSPWPR